MLTLFAIVYFIIAAIFIILDVLDIRNKKDISLFNFFRLSFAGFQCVIPSVIIWRIANHTNVSQIQANEIELPKIIFEMIIITVLEYLVVTLFYRGTKPSKSYYYSEGSGNLQPNNISLSIMLIVSAVSLFLWTRAFGSVFNFILNADSIRASYSTVYNQWAFLEHFSALFYIGLYLAIDNAYRKKDRGIVEIVLVVGFLIGSITVMLCTDARGALGQCLIVIAVYIFKIKSNKGKDSVKLLIRFGVVLLAAFFLSSIAGTFFDYFRFKTSISINNGSILDIIEKELSFTINSKIHAMPSNNDNLLCFYFYNDFVNALLAWVPSRFTIGKIPEKLWVYNSLILGGRGTSPTDFITASIYMFGLPGVVILPAIFGIVLKKIDTALNRLSFNSTRAVYFSFFSYISIWWAGYFGLYNTMLMLFASLLAYIITRVVNNIIMRRNRNS